MSPLRRMEPLFILLRHSRKTVSYVELRAHTAWSFGDGVLTPEALVTRAAELGYRALGLTDHADLGGLIRFTLAAQEAGVKPVAGAELEVDGHPVAFLARNAAGYRNLAALVTKSRMGELREWGEGEGNGKGEGVVSAPSRSLSVSRDAPAPTLSPVATRCRCRIVGARC